MTRPHYLADEVPKMAAELLTLRASLAAAQSRVAALESVLQTLLNAMRYEPELQSHILTHNGDCLVHAARAALASPPPHDGARSERREGDALDQAYRWILLHGIDGNRDGACAECYPGSDIPPAFAGFRCAWHHAQVACAPPAAPKGEA